MKSKNTIQRVNISLSIPLDMKKKLDNYAAKTNRSRNNLIKVLIMRTLEVLSVVD